MGGALHGYPRCNVAHNITINTSSTSTEAALDARRSISMLSHPLLLWLVLPTGRESCPGQWMMRSRVFCLFFWTRLLLSGQSARLCGENKMRYILNTRIYYTRTSCLYILSDMRRRYDTIDNPRQAAWWVLRPSLSETCGHVKPTTWFTCKDGKREVQVVKYLHMAGICGCI